MIGLQAEFLIKGFSHEFSLQYRGPRAFRDTSNLPSANLQPDVIMENIGSEIVLGRIAGPFSSPPFLDLHISPVMLMLSTKNLQKSRNKNRYFLVKI